MFEFHIWVRFRSGPRSGMEGLRKRVAEFDRNPVARVFPLNGSVFLTVDGHLNRRTPSVDEILGIVSEEMNASQDSHGMSSWCNFDRSEEFIIETLVGGDPEWTPSFILKSNQSKSGSPKHLVGVDRGS